MSILLFRTEYITCQHIDHPVLAVNAERSAVGVPVDDVRYHGVLQVSGDYDAVPALRDDVRDRDVLHAVAQVDAVSAVSLAEKYRAAVREARLCAGNRGAARSGHAGADADSDRHRPRRQAGHGQVSPLTQKPICVKLPASAQDDVDIVPYAGFEIL